MHLSKEYATKEYNIMKKLLYLCLILASGCSTSEKTKISNDLTINELKGNVKSIREIDYAVIIRFDSIIKDHIGTSIFDKNRKSEYNTSGMLTLNVNYDKYNNITKEQTNEYDEFGNWLRESIHEKEDSTSWAPKPERQALYVMKYDNNRDRVEWVEYDEDDRLKLKRTYKYDSRSNIIEQNEYFNDGALSSKSIYEYTDGYNLKIINYNSKGQITKEITNEFDNNGNKIEILTNYAWLDFESRLTYKYDHQGNEIESVEFERGNLRNKMQSTYDLKGRIIYTIETFPQDQNINYTRYKYDRIGSLIEWKTTYEDKRKIPESHTFSFIYDEHQNWIKKISYRNFIPEKITERKITYH